MFSTSLSFNGKAEEAIKFYASVFGYELKDSDIHRWENGLVAHGEVLIYQNRLMFCDYDEPSSFGGFSLSINLTNAEELTQKYNALSKGAEIIEPLGEVPWSKLYGVLKDKFGVVWQFNLD